MTLTAASATSAASAASAVSATSAASAASVAMALIQVRYLYLCALFLMRIQCLRPGYLNTTCVRFYLKQK